MIRLPNHELRQDVVNTKAKLNSRSTRNLLAFVFVGLFFVASGAGNLNADEKIAPVAMYIGKHHTDIARPAIPANGVITDQKTLEMVWTKLSVQAEIPTVNWNEQLFVVDSVDGPNRLSVGFLTLSDQGDLNFNSRSTRMGGPGFGYILIQVPSRGVKTVKGKSILAGDLELKPIGTYHGKHFGNALKSFLPANKMITNQADLTRICDGLGMDTRPTTVNWEKEFVLAGSIEGPNSIHQVILNRKADGNLRFELFGTEIGPPGFGFVLVHLSKAGIKSVNSKPVAGAVGKPAIGIPTADSVSLDVVGKLQTGIMAIGGETTGTIITADNITFEVDLTFDRGLKAQADRLNNQQVRLKGKLTKKRGVEVPVRWIVKATYIEKVAGGKDQVPKPEPQADTFDEVRLAISGGIAGLDDELTITKDGKATNVKRRQRISESWNVEKTKLAKIHALIGSVDWKNLPAGEGASSFPDAMKYTFTIDTGKGVFKFSRNDRSLMRTKELMELSRLMQR